jgi:hypothetical protein
VTGDTMLQAISASLEVADAEDRLRLAMLSSDIAVLDALLSEGLTFVDQNGRVLSKADDLDAHRSGLLRLSRLDYSTRRIQPTGHCAVVTLRADIEGAYAITPFSGLFAYTRVWGHFNGTWRVLAAHCSMVCEPAP